jgi:hypothetical protein
MIRSFRKSLVVPLAAAIVVLFFCRGAAAEQSAAQTINVEGLTVKLVFQSRVPDAVESRIEDTVRNVGKKALEGRSVEEAEALKVSLVQVMKKIFTEVLSGFDVLDLGMELGPPVVITLDLDVRKPHVEKVRFEILPQAGIHEHWHAAFAAALRPMEAELAEQLYGIPVESARWTGAIASGIVKEQLVDNKYFVGFALDPDVEIANETVIRLSVKPVSKTIRSVSVKTRSTTMPSLLLERLKFDLAAQGDVLIGLPIVFAIARQDDIVNYFREYIQSNSQAHRLGLTLEVKPIITERYTQIRIKAESDKYSGFLRGKVSVGKENRNPDVEGHLGLFVREGTEVFSEVNFFPGPIDLQFNMGIGQRLGPKLYVAGGRNFVDDLNRIWIDYYVNEDIFFSWEKNVVDVDKEKTEGSVTFKAHDFFSIDLVTDFHTKTWVRFVTNL